MQLLGKNKGSKFYNLSGWFFVLKAFKIKTELWVQAQIKLCDINFIPIVVRKKGDPDSGAIILKIRQKDSSYRVLSQVRDHNGNLSWMYCGGGESIDDDQSEIYIRNQINLDPDLWVIEIEDQEDKYQLLGDILKTT